MKIDIQREKIEMNLVISRKHELQKMIAKYQSQINQLGSFDFHKRNEINKQIKILKAELSRIEGSTN